MLNDILGRPFSIFHSDFEIHKEELVDKLSSVSVVVVGGAGTIGSSVLKVLISLSLPKTRSGKNHGNLIVQISKE